MVPALLEDGCCNKYLYNLSCGTVMPRWYNFASSLTLDDCQFTYSSSKVLVIMKFQFTDRDYRQLESRVARPYFSARRLSIRLCLIQEYSTISVYTTNTYLYVGMSVLGICMTRFLCPSNDFPLPGRLLELDI